MDTMQPRHPILEYRLRHSLSQSDFAEKLSAAGCSATQSLVSQYELGKVAITVERAAEIERVCGGEILLEDLIDHVSAIRDRAGRLVGYTVTVGDAPQDEAA